VGLLEKYKERLETIELIMETKSEAADPIGWAQYVTMKQQTELFISDLKVQTELFCECKELNAINRVCKKCK